METPTAPRFKSIFSEPRPSCDELPLYAHRKNMSAREQYKAAYRAERNYCKGITNNAIGLTAEINHYFLAVHGYHHFYVDAARTSEKALESEKLYATCFRRRLWMMRYNDIARQRIAVIFFGYKEPASASVETEEVSF